jgi:hypothetical protein
MLSAKGFSKRVLFPKLTLQILVVCPNGDRCKSLTWVEYGRHRIWVGQRELTCVRDRCCGIGHSFGRRADHIRYRRGWNPLHRRPTVCTPGDTTSTDVDLGPHKIDWVPIFIHEEKRDAETESFLSGTVSRASLSAFSRRCSLSFCLRRFDFDVSRPEPEESELTEEMDRERRWDSQILIE